MKGRIADSVIATAGLRQKVTSAYFIYPSKSTALRQIQLSSTTTEWIRPSIFKQYVPSRE
ncbi:hypothetical protein P3T40_004581 [Paraburkholderia sp. EB58]